MREQRLFLVLLLPCMAMAVSGCGGTNWPRAVERRFSVDHACPLGGVSVGRANGSYVAYGCGSSEQYAILSGSLYPLSVRVRERFRIEHDCLEDVFIGGLGRSAWQVEGCGHVNTYEYTELGIVRVSHRSTD